MYKVYSKKVISAMVASSLVFGLGSAVATAAPAKETQTARTEQQRATGVITPDPVTVPRYAKEVTVTGTVVIDGPQLVVTIPEAIGVTVQKVADKTWTYSAVLKVEGLEGNQTYTISAKTIYTSGKPAGDTHTLAKEIQYQIHVPYIMSTVAENVKFPSYDPASNLFTVTYDEVENWSTGDPVITQKGKTVIGTESEVEILDKSYNVPLAVRDITFPMELTAENYIWDEASKTYSVSFSATVENSRGETQTELVNVVGLAPGQSHSGDFTPTGNYAFNLTKTYSYIAPAAPAPAVPTLTNVSVTSADYTWTGNNANGGNVQANYTLNYSLNGESFSIVKSFTFNSGVGYKDQNLIETVTYKGQSVDISYTLVYKEPSSTDDNTTGGNNKGGNN